MTDRCGRSRFEAVGTSLARLRRFRPDPLTLDRTLATLLTVGAELQVWLGGSAGDHRVAAALVAPAGTASVAVRRRYPTPVGMGVPVLTAFQLALWGDPQIAPTAV